jgi:hypothetical protein
MSSAAIGLILRDASNTMTEGASAAPKRSLFNKPTWAAKTITVAKTETDFFDHRDSTYSAILAEREKKRQKHRAKAAAVAENRDGHDAKRRRLSNDEDTDLDTESGEEEEEARSQYLQREGPATRSTPTKKGQTASPSLDHSSKQFSPIKSLKAPNTRIIDLEGKEDEVNPITESLRAPQEVSRVMPRPKPLSSDPESEDEDEYTLELKRKARERARLQRLGLDTSTSMKSEPQSAKSQSPQLGGPSQPDSAKSPEAPLHERSPQSSESRKEEDIKVMILIRTAIPNTNQLIVNRWASQNLQQVKEAWCKRQGFDASMAKRVFLTWRGNKLFNTTTLTHILRTLKAEKKKSGVGNLDRDEEDSDLSEGKIEVEAVTEDILTERKRVKEKEDRLADASNGDEGLPLEEVGESRPRKEPDVQLILNSPSLESVALKVRPTTLISKVMAGFKKIRQVDQEKICWLIFDGERLNPETRICDTEIEDGDVVDVQIR